MVWKTNYKHEVVCMKIYTIGHSTHTKNEFLNMLQFAKIEILVDVRAFPGSRKFPQFNKETMKEWLEEADIKYYHLVDLGGRRKKSTEVDSKLNGAWNNQSFHNYADYSLTDQFKKGLNELTHIAKNHRTAYCCSERHPSRCHRLIISNWLAAKGWSVEHIIDGNQRKIECVKHELGQWGAMPIIEEDGAVIYPKI